MNRTQALFALLLATGPALLPTPAAAAPEPLIIGNLDVSLVEAVIRRDQQQIEFCHQRALKQQPGLHGDVVVKFHVDKDGKVDRTSVKSSTLENEAVETCITERIARLQFPPPPGGGLVIVSWPFSFGAPPPPDPAVVEVREKKKAAEQALFADTGITETFGAQSVSLILKGTALCRVTTEQFGTAACELDTASRFSRHWCASNYAPAVAAADVDVVDALLEEACRYEGGFTFSGQPVAFGPEQCTAQLQGMCR